MGRQFSVYHEGRKLLSVGIRENEIEIVPQNLLENLKLLPFLISSRGILNALRKGGYRVVVRKGPLKLSLREGE